ncbi:MAG: hypothetical protein K2F87_06295 [Muribaculaceae bacterium]|nr:hypothetical protein [Muribaculaceae bacterium]
MDKVSDEMLAAYLDGNATLEECMLISNDSIDLPTFIQAIQLSPEISVPTDFSIDMEMCSGMLMSNK